MTLANNYVKGRETISKAAAVVDWAYSTQLQDICSKLPQKSLMPQGFETFRTLLKLQNLLQKALFSGKEVF